MPESNQPFTSYRVGLHNVGSYQVSGVPWITGSASLAVGAEDKIEFPFVAKSITIINTEAAVGGDLYVHFNATGSGNVIGGRHFIILNDNKDSVTINTKCKEIYLSNPGTEVSAVTAYTVIVELTSIGTNSMYVLTGSGLTD